MANVAQCCRGGGAVDLGLALEDLSSLSQLDYELLQPTRWFVYSRRRQ